MRSFGASERSLLLNGLEIGTLVGYFVPVYALGFWGKIGETTGEFLIDNRSVGTLLTTE